MIIFTKASLLIFFTILFATVAHSKPNELYRYLDPKTDLYGFKEVNGKIIIPSQFDMVEAPDDSPLFSNKNKDLEYLVPVLKKCRFWRMNREGQLKFESFYFDNGADYYEEGLTRFIKDGKVGFHTRKGEIKIQARYDFASPFRNGYAYVCKGCYAQYPKNPTYAAASSGPCSHLNKDMYKSIISGAWGLIDKEGKEVVPLSYKSTEEVDEVAKRLKLNS